MVNRARLFVLHLEMPLNFVPIPLDKDNLLPQRPGAQSGNGLLKKADAIGIVQRFHTEHLIQMRHFGLGDLNASLFP